MLLSLTKSAAAVALSAATAATLIVTPEFSETLRTFSPGVALQASEALIMHGTDEYVTPEWLATSSRDFITPTTGTSYTAVPVAPYDKVKLQLWPFTGVTSLTYSDSAKQGSEILSAQIHALAEQNSRDGSPADPIVVLGYSQSSQISSIVKQGLQDAVDGGAELPPVTFVLLANPLRPNGGLSARFSGIGPLATPWTPIVYAPTDTQFETHDIARQYDFFADFPAYPLNPFATANAVFGLLNHNYGPVSLDPSSPSYDPDTVVQQYGDTAYYLIPSKELPLLAPVRAVGLDPVADAVEPTLRVLVELGYDRETPYGVHTTVGIAPRVNAPEVVSDVRASVAQGAASVRASVAGAVRTPVLGRAEKVSDPETQAAASASVESVEPVRASAPERTTLRKSVRDSVRDSVRNSVRESIRESVRKVTVKNKTPDADSGSAE